MRRWRLRRCVFARTLQQSGQLHQSRKGLHKVANVEIFTNAVERRPRASVRFADAQPGDNGNDAGQGEQEGEDIVGNSEGGAAEGTLHRKYSSSSQGSNKSIKTISNHRI